MMPAPIGGAILHTEDPDRSRGFHIAFLRGEGKADVCAMWGRSGGSKVAMMAARRPTLTPRWWGLDGAPPKYGL
jgi:hypothetical protein